MLREASLDKSRIMQVQLQPTVNLDSDKSSDAEAAGDGTAVHVNVDHRQQIAHLISYFDNLETGYMVCYDTQAPQHARLFPAGWLADLSIPY